MARGRKLASLTLIDEQQNQLQGDCSIGYPGLRPGRAGPHHPRQRRRLDQCSRRQACRRHTAHRRQVAPTLPGGRHPGVARRNPVRTAPDLRRRQGGERNQPRVAGDTRHRHALEHARAGAGRGPFQEHGAALARPLRRQTAPGADLQAVDRPVFHREGARHRRVVPQPARPRDGPVRGREVADSGAQSHPADAADGLGLRRRLHPRLRPARHDDAVRRPGHPPRGRCSGSTGSGTATRSSCRSCA